MTGNAVLLGCLHGVLGYRLVVPEKLALFFESPGHNIGLYLIPET